MEIKQYIKENEARFMEELFSLIRIPSISALPEHKDDMLACALRWKELLLAAGASRSGIRLRLKINFSNNSKKPGNVISRRSNAPTIFVFTLSSNSLSNILKLCRCSIIYKHFCWNTLNCS